MASKEGPASDAFPGHQHPDARGGPDNGVPAQPSQQSYGWCPMPGGTP